MTEPDFEIELLDEGPEPEGAVCVPENVLLLGQLSQDDVHIYIHQRVYKALEELAASDTAKELGSILLGDYTQQGDTLHVVITDYIEAKFTDASAATLTFTHETWDYIHGEHTKRFPDKKIIGWQHTHPSYGIFLSNYDLFIQENFFDLPFQIAYVIDPVQDLRGFFQWKDGKVMKLHGYHVYDAAGKKLAPPRQKQKKQAKKANSLLALLVVILGVICLGTGICTGVLLHYVAQQSNSQEEAWTVYQSQIDGLSAQVAEQAQLLQEQALLIAQLQTQQAAPQPEDTGVTLRFTVYTVAPGDTLEEICRAQGIDYATNVRLILAVNRMADPNMLRAGQQILLPIP